MGIQVGNDVPERFVGLHPSEAQQVKFRCPHCGISHQATVLPGSPQTAKFHCRQCEHVIEVETRPSAMDEFESEVEERKHYGHLKAKARVFSKAVSPLVQTKLGAAYLIG